ncbi:hypothetical protein TSMEX_007292 [Taenia solium]
MANVSTSLTWQGNPLFAAISQLSAPILPFFCEVGHSKTHYCFAANVSTLQLNWLVTLLRKDVGATASNVDTYFKELETSVVYPTDQSVTSGKVRSDPLNDINLVKRFLWIAMNMEKILLNLIGMMIKMFYLLDLVFPIHCTAFYLFQSRCLGEFLCANVLVKIVLLHHFHGQELWFLLIA